MNRFLPNALRPSVIVSVPLLFASVFLLVSTVRSEAAGGASAALELMKKEMYRDAAKILEKAVTDQGDEASAQELRMLGECYYFLGDNGKARSVYNRALQYQTTRIGKVICESRLAILAFRLGDVRGAQEQIENFLRKYPDDERAGTLLVVRMKVNAAGQIPGGEKLRLVEADYRKFENNKKLYGYYNSVLACQILGDLYTQSGNEDKAVSLFITAVHEMRGLLTEFKNTGRPIPRDLMQGADSMSLQIARHHINRKNWNEAEKWLENVGYVDDVVTQAKLLLAQILYQRAEYNRVLYTLPDRFLKTVPEGKVRSNMCLLLGFTHLDMKNGDLEAAKEFLKQVKPDVAGFVQAQHGLGDVYRRQNDPDRAEKFYLESVKVAKFEGAAHFYLGQIYKDRAGKVTGLPDQVKAQRTALLEKAAEHFQQVIIKYPLTDLARDAKPILDGLLADGVRVTVVTSDEGRVAIWEKSATATNAVAAQALISLAQYYSRSTQDAKDKALKPPDWNACARVCNRILQQGSKAFEGVTDERWQEMGALAALLAGRAQLGSLPAGPSARRAGALAPVPIEGGGSAEKAIELFQLALSLTPQAKKDFRKDADLSLLEAMFKSRRAEVREEAQKKYAERETEYGGDPQYQRLLVVLADWYAEQEQFPAAAKLYRDISRKSSLDREEVMHLLYLAGVYYNKAGVKATGDRTTQAGLGFMIYPRELIKTGTILKTHEPFQATKTVFWDVTGADPTALDALKRVSKEYGVPFVWSPSDHPGSVANFLQTTTIPRAKLVEFRGSRSLEEYMGLILDLKKYRLDFDVGASGGAPTLKPVEADQMDRLDQARVIEVWDPSRERFPALAVPYGSFQEAHRGSAMLFHILQRVEGATGAKIFWAEGIDRDDMLAREFKRIPDVAEGASVSCTEALGRVLTSLGLRYEVIRRDKSTEWMHESNDCFNELRKFGQDTKYAEEAMFNLAINFYYLQDFPKMKLILGEYLKTFDTSSHANYYDACFWLGWVFERERKFRDAVKYYTIATEENVILYKLKEGEAPPTAESVRALLNYDTLFNLSQKASGEFKEFKLAGEFVSFVRFHSNVELKVDPSARALETAINRPEFTGVSCLDLILDVMKELGLGLRTENGNRDVAEKGYFRLAMVYKNDEILPQALEYVNTLLTRFPKTRRRVDALKLKLDIYRGLKDYTRVQGLLEELRTAAEGVVDGYKLDYEAGRIYFDLCDYAQAESFYARALSGAKGEEDWLKIREGLAYAYLRREERRNDALTQFRNLLRYETTALRNSVNTLMVHYLENVTLPPDTRKPLPPEEWMFIQGYEKMTDEARGQLSPNEAARATWIYYTLGLLHQQDRKFDEALREFDAASVSPDTLMAGDALLRIAQIRMERAEFPEARQALEHLLFAVSAVEPTVRATYELGVCYQRMDKSDQAFKRLQEVVDRYPFSPYAEKAKKEPLYLERTGGAAAPPVPGPGAPAAAPTNAPASGAVKSS